MLGDGLFVLGEPCGVAAGDQLGQGLGHVGAQRGRGGLDAVFGQAFVVPGEQVDRVEPAWAARWSWRASSRAEDSPAMRAPSSSPSAAVARVRTLCVSSSAEVSR